jgi:hypothetical protein
LLAKHQSAVRNFFAVANSELPTDKILYTFTHLPKPIKAVQLAAVSSPDALRIIRLKFNVCTYFYGTVTNTGEKEVEKPSLKFMTVTKLFFNGSSSPGLLFSSVIIFHRR